MKGSTHISNLKNKQTTTKNTWGRNSILERWSDTIFKTKNKTMKIYRIISEIKLKLNTISKHTDTGFPSTSERTRASIQ